MSLLSLTPPISEDGPVEPDPIGHPFQSTDDSQRMSQVTFKAMGSEEAQLVTSPKIIKVSLIYIHKTTVLVEAKGQCYYTVSGGRGVPVGYCNKSLTWGSFTCTKTKALVLKLKTSYT